MIKKHVSKAVTKAKTTKWEEIKYFHPEGKSMPNGINYQRGGFCNECRINKNNFILDEEVYNKQSEMSKYKGVIIVFSTDLNAAVLDQNESLNTINQIISDFKNRKQSVICKILNKINAKCREDIAAYSVGNFFKGRYVGDHGEIYNDKSLSVEINGLSKESLFRVAEIIAQEYMQKTVVVKDLNKNKLYIGSRVAKA